MDGTQSDKQSRRLVITGLFSRILTDTSSQMFYAFFPILAAGMGVSSVTFGRLLSVRSSAGFLTPVFGNMIERRGYRVTLPLILIAASIGSLLLAASPSLPFIVVAIFIMGIGTTVFQPLFAAYTSNTFPPEYRARYMGMIEYGWALSSIVGVYVVGQVLEISSWRVPLIGIGVLFAIMAAVFAQLLRNQPDADDTPPISMWEQFHITENRKEAYGAVFMQSIIIISALHFFISYSIWLNDQYQFDAVQLASIVLTFGFVDLIGSGLVSLVLDRLGRRNALMLGSGLSSIAFMLLVLFNQWGLIPALGMLFFGRFLFEFTIVSGVITVSEQSPNQRSRVMSLLGFFGTISQALAGLTGPVAYVNFGLAGLGVPTAIGFVVVALLARHYIRPTS